MSRSPVSGGKSAPSRASNVPFKTMLAGLEELHNEEMEGLRHEICRLQAKVSQCKTATPEVFEYPLATARIVDIDEAAGRKNTPDISWPIGCQRTDRRVQTWSGGDSSTLSSALRKNDMGSTDSNGVGLHDVTARRANNDQDSNVSPGSKAHSESTDSGPIVAAKAASERSVSKGSSPPGSVVRQSSETSKSSVKSPLNNVKARLCSWSRISEKSEKSDDSPDSPVRGGTRPVLPRSWSHGTKTEEEEAQEFAQKISQHRNSEANLKHSSNMAMMIEDYQVGDFRRKTKEIVASYRFEVFFAAAIISNSILLGVRVDSQIQVNDTPGGDSFLWSVLEISYTVLFTMELMLRVIAEGLGIFCRWRDVHWFYLDVVVVVTSILEVVLELAKQGSHDTQGNELASLGNSRMFRMIRLIRIVKVLRIARVVRFVRALRKLVLSIVFTLRSVVWACVLLVMIIYGFALTIVQAVDAYEEELTSDLKLYWGTLPRSMFTLYKSISGGISWHEVVMPLGEVNPALVGVFTIYVSFTTLAVLNVITGVFCEAAMESARQDYELMVQQHLHQKDQFTGMVYDAFGVPEADRGADFEMSYKDFEDALGNPHTKAYLASIELDSSDAWELFKLLDEDGSALIDVHEFVNGCLRLKGVAKAIDIAKLHYEAKMRAKTMARFMNSVEDKLSLLQLTLKDRFPM